MEYSPRRIQNLTDEIKRRVSYQLLILGGNVTFISAVIGTLSDKFDANHLTMILLLPLVSFVIVWLFFEQDVFVTQPARYLHRALRPAILRCIAKKTGGKADDLSEVMAWEAFRSKLLFDPNSSYRGFFRSMVLFRWFATIGPGLALLVAAAYIPWHSRGGAACADAIAVVSIYHRRHWSNFRFCHTSPGRQILSRNTRLEI